MISRSLNAEWLGERTPASHDCTVLTLTFKITANTPWEYSPFSLICLISSALYSRGGSGSSISFVLNVLFLSLYSRISSKPFFIFWESVLVVFSFPFNFFDELLEYCFILFRDIFLLIFAINHDEK